MNETTAPEKQHTGGIPGGLHSLSLQIAPREKSVSRRISLSQAIAAVKAPGSEKQRHFLAAVISLCLPLMLILSTFENNSRIGRIIFTSVPLLLGAWCWWQGWFSLKPLRIVVIALGVVFSALLISSATSIEPAYSFGTFFEQHLWYGLLMLLVAVWGTTAGRQMAFLRGLFLAGFISAVFGVFFYYFAFDLERLGWIRKASDYVYVSHAEGGEMYLRARGMLESYTRSGLVMVFALPAGLAMLMSACRERRKGETVFVLAASVVCIWYLLLTMSRGAWVTAVLACAVTLVLLRGRWWIWTGAGLFVIACFAVMPAERARAKTFVTHLSEPDLLFSGRLDLWRQGFEPIRQHTLTGLGYGGNIFLTDTALQGGYELFTDRRQPDLHSLYLQTLAETGILGCLAYLFFAGVMAWIGYEAVRSERLRGGLPGIPVAAGIMVGMAVCGLTYYFNEAPLGHLLWPTAGLLLTGRTSTPNSETTTPAII